MYYQDIGCCIHLFMEIRSGSEGDVLAAVRANPSVHSVDAGGVPFKVNAVLRAEDRQGLGIAVLKLIADLGDAIQSVECSPAIMPYEDLEVGVARLTRKAG